jgi:hypothetical protein
MTAPAAMNPRQFNFGSYLFTLQWIDSNASLGDWEYPQKSNLPMLSKMTPPAGELTFGTAERTDVL